MVHGHLQALLVVPLRHHPQELDVEDARHLLPHRHKWWLRHHREAAARHRDPPRVHHGLHLGLGRQQAQSHHRQVGRPDLQGRRHQEVELEHGAQRVGRPQFCFVVVVVGVVAAVLVAVAEHLGVVSAERPHLRVAHLLHRGRQALVRRLHRAHPRL